MTRKNTVTALALGVFAFALLLLLPVPTASSQPSVDRKVACESKGNRWDSERGRCIKILKKRTLPSAEQAPEQTQPNTSGGVGGGCPPGYSEYQGRCALYQDGKIIQFF
jgi:hypothetical protein